MDVESTLSTSAAEGLDARGVEITEELLERIVAAGPVREGRHSLRAVRFDNACFVGSIAKFDEVDFLDFASFERATFECFGSFIGARFEGDARFDSAVFNDQAWFMETRFVAEARFPEAEFADDATFGLTRISGEATFFDCTFWKEARFPGAAFSRDASFADSLFGGAATFEGANFGRGALFPGAAFAEDADFSNVTFEHARNLEPSFVGGTLTLDAATFAEPVRVVASAARCSCARAQFRGGANFFLRWAELALDEAELAGPSLVTTSPGDDELLDDGRWLCNLERRDSADASARVVSLRRANVGNLVLSGADLRSGPLPAGVDTSGGRFL